MSSPESVRSLGVAPSRDPDRAARELQWFERIAAGDEQAFQSLFETYYAALCGFVHSYVRSTETAEEVVQTVFLRLWERRAASRPAMGVRAYLFAACRNQALGILKHERIAARTTERAISEQFSPGTAGAAPPPDAQVVAAELAAALREAVQALPERRRMVLALRWEHQMSHAEIAAVLGVSPKTVEVQLGRALAALRKRLAHLRV